MERPPRKRRRPALSCVECRRRKIKCDRDDPCAHCVATRARCAYRVFGGGLGGERSSAAVVPEQWDGARTPVSDGAASSGGLPPTTLVEGAPLQSDETGRASTCRTLPCHGQSSGSASVLPQDAGSGIDTPDSSDRHTETAANAKMPAAGSTLGQYPVAEGSQISLYKTRAFTSSHWMGATQDLAAIYGYWSKIFTSNDDRPFQNVPADNLAHDIRQLHQRSKVLAKTIKTKRPSTFPCPWNDSNTTAAAALHPPARADADAMIALYFRFFESSHRILHRPTFRADYDAYWDSPDSAPAAARLTVLLVVAAGASLHDCDAPEHLRLRASAQSVVCAAHAWLALPLGKDRLCVAGLQVYCLALVVRQGYNIGGDLLWDSCGGLVQRAMQLGLHRDPGCMRGMSVLEAEVRRRLWATALEMAVQSSLDSSLPPRIGPGDYDTKRPLNVTDEELAGEGDVQARPMTVFTETWMQCTLADSLPTRLKIVQLLNGLQSEIQYQHVISLTSEIKAALTKIHQFAKANGSDAFTTFHQNLADYLVRRFLIPLHSSFAHRSRRDPLLHYSLHTAVEASLGVILTREDDAWSRLMIRGGGPFREGIMCATTIVGIELVAQIKARQLDGTIGRILGCTDVLKKAIQEALHMALDRLQQQAETSTKCHMFFSMLLAQAEVAEDETEELSESLGMLRAIKISIELCVDILRAQVETVPCGSPRDVCFTTTDSEGGLDDFMMGLDFDFFTP